MMKEIVSHFGGQKALADALNVSPPAVAQWVQQGAFPARRAIEIETLTEGKFRAIDIPTMWSRPDE